MRQMLRTGKLIQVLLIADYGVLETFHRIFDELATFYSFVLVEVYLPLIVRSGGRNKMAGCFSGAPITPPSNEVQLFFHTVHFVNQLRVEIKLTVTVHYN